MAVETDSVAFFTAKPLELVDDSVVHQELLEEDKTLFHENGLWLINNLITDSVMKAEFYREIGEVDTARSILDSITVEDEFLKRIVTAIKDRLEVNNCQVFKLQTS